jgi:hypothetical protein
MLAPDRSWTVLLDVRITESRSDWMSKPLPGETSLADLIWVPGEGSSTGNMTGGRKFARHYFVARQTRSLPFSSAGLPNAGWRSGPAIVQAVPMLDACGYALAETSHSFEMRLRAAQENVDRGSP